MIEFVEECRQEWKRLRVPDPVANEMAADLEADLKEAEAEGASAEEVLGSGAFDPRSFATSWAVARGVVQQGPVAADQAPVAAEWPPVAEKRPSRRWGVIVAVAVSGLMVFVGAVLVAHRDGSSVQAFASPTAPRDPLPGPIGIVATSDAHAAQLGIILLIFGLVALIVYTLYWSLWARSSGSSAWRPQRDHASR